MISVNRTAPRVLYSFPIICNDLQSCLSVQETASRVEVNSRDIAILIMDANAVEIIFKKSSNISETS